MGWFRKKRPSDSILPYDIENIPMLNQNNNISTQKRVIAPYALTPDELMHSNRNTPEHSVENIIMEKHEPQASTRQEDSQTLYYKLLEAKKQLSEKIGNINQTKTGTSTQATYRPPEQPTTSLLYKMRDFIADSGDPDSYFRKPKYQLESVEEIIRSAEKKAQERIAKIYGTQEDGISNLKLEFIDPLSNRKPGISQPPIKGEIEAPSCENMKGKTDEEKPAEQHNKVQIKKVTPRRFTKNTPGSSPAVSREAKEVPVKIAFVDPNQKTDTLATNKQFENPSNNAAIKAKNFQFSYADENIKISDYSNSNEKTKELHIPITEKSPIDTSSSTAHTTAFNFKELDEIFDQNEKSDWEIELEKRRRSTAKKFSLFGDEEEDNFPDEVRLAVEQEEDLEIDDYNCYDDANSVWAELNSNRRRLIFRIIPTFIIVALLVFLATPFAEFIKAANYNMYLLANILLLSLCSLININTMKGLAGIFTLKPDMDTPAALAVFAVLIHSVLGFALNAGDSIPQLSSVASVALLFNAFGKLAIVSRIRKGFKFVATPDPKYGIQLVENEMAAASMARGAVYGDALIGIGRRTTNITHYLRNSYCVDPFERLIPKLLAIATAASAGFGLLAFFMSGCIIPAITLATTVFCLACPPTSLLLSNLPLRFASVRLGDYKAAITGYDAVETLSESNAVVFDALDLFPAGTVKLYNMHLLNNNPVDQTIIEASALAIGAKSTLTDIFDRILEYDRSKLPVVDSITYEDKMGLSGWIGDKRILVGNRTLMEAHGVTVPPIEVDRKILRNGFFPVYISSGGAPCLLFVVGYEANEEITLELRRLCNTGMTLLINSNDPNITEQMLSDYFGLYVDSIKIMDPVAVQLYKQEANYQENTNALALYTDTVCGFAAALTACIKLKSTIAANTVVHILGVILGIALAAYFVLTSHFTFITALWIIIYQLFFTVITSLISLRAL
ncbi:MAG TPA: hypothetical protein GXX17_07720 [Clostridiales bacterium]|nr:hypothetical protein [Clostridiales bacterium]